MEDDFGNRLFSYSDRRAKLSRPEEEIFSVPLFSYPASGHSIKSSASRHD